MKALWGTGGITPTHSQSRHKMGVSDQHHAPAALYPRGKDPRYPLDKRLGGVAVLQFNCCHCWKCVFIQICRSKCSNTSVASCESSSVLFYINPKFRKRQIFKLDLEICITGKFYQRFLGFYEKVTYFLTDCDCIHSYCWRVSSGMRFLKLLWTLVRWVRTWGLISSNA
jgi:hypothetical protein